jgi:hypothetical protein
MIPHDGRISRRSTPRPKLSEAGKLAKRIGEVMARMDHRISTTIDAQHIALRGLSENAQREARDLQAAQERITRGEAIVEAELDTMHKSYRNLYAAVKAEKTSFEKRVAQELLSQQAQHQQQAEISTHLHHSIGESSQASLTRDQQLEAGLEHLKKEMRKGWQAHASEETELKNKMEIMEDYHTKREQDQHENMLQLRREHQAELRAVKAQMAEITASANRMAQALETAIKRIPR